MNRRHFLALAGAASATLALPGVGLAQQSTALAPGMKRLGFIFTLTPDDPTTPLYLSAMRDGLASQGWVEGKNLTIDIAYMNGTTQPLAAKAAADIFAKRPDAVLAFGSQPTVEMQKLTRTIPIVFVQVADPVGNGIVSSIARPGGNVTGISQYDGTVGGVLLELLQEVRPDLKNATMIWVPNAPGMTDPNYASFEAAGKSLGIATRSVALIQNDAANISKGIADVAAMPNSGLAVSNNLVVNRATVLQAVDQYRLPAVYYHVLYALDGGLMSYAYDIFLAMKNAAVDAGLVLKGTDPGTIPVQVPQDVQLIVNLKTAKAQGITLPQTILARADQVIQ